MRQNPTFGGLDGRVTVEVRMAMISRTSKLAISLGITLTLGSVFASLGCGGSAGSGSDVPAHSDVEVPNGIARQIRTCAAQHLAHLGSGEKSIRFDVRLASDGQVEAVSLGESTLGDEEAETCMAHALRSLSADDLPMRRSENRSRGFTAPESRELIGNPTVALAPVSLVPVLITGIGIIVVVAVVIYMTTDQDSDEEKARCKKVKEGCIDTCTETSLPTPDFGVKFRRCMRACMEAQNCVF